METASDLKYKYSYLVSSVSVFLCLYERMINQNFIDDFYVYFDRCWLKSQLLNDRC